jgi:hypothetical protein
VEAEELKWLLALCLVVAPMWASAATPDPVGHYYLSGVHEVGSELLLKPDGRYDWYMSYGSVDQFSKGTWRRAESTIVLTADVADPKAAVFKLEAQAPWNERAEDKAQEAPYQARVSAVYGRCPFLVSDGDMTSAPAMYRDVADPAEKAKAEAAAVFATLARAKFERAAAVALTKNSNHKETMRAATEAIKAWRLAESAMDEAYSKAGLPTPRLAEPKLPAVCTFPSEPNAANIAPGKWLRGVAVNVADPAVEMRFSGITVVFGYTDGTTSAGVVTDNGGWALAPVRKTVKRVTLSLRGDDPHTASFEIKPMAEGIQPVTLDSQKVVAPPFSELTLRIDGEDLVPENDRGRYSRH